MAKYFGRLGLIVAVLALLGIGINNSYAANPPAPVVAVTSPANNSILTSGTNIRIIATASESSGKIIEVDFYNGATLLGTSTASPYSYTWPNVPAGSYSLTAIAIDTKSKSTTSGVKKVTVSDPPVVSVTSPGNNATYTLPASIVINASASASSGTITKVAFYNGTTLLSIATKSPYSYTWSKTSGTGSFALSAVATQTNGLTGSSSKVSITVSPHVAPTVSLTSPANNSSYWLSANVPLTASAGATNAKISKVAFYNGIKLLATITKSPYSYTMSKVTAGTYKLTAVVTDSTGATATSTVASVIVTTHVAPKVSLTSPINKASYTAPNSVTLTASASASDNATIAQVDFYNGTTLLGTVSSSPYTYIWNNALPGSYSLTAVATDSTGATNTSLAISGTVIEPSPMVSLSANNSTYAAPAAITLTATASQVDGTISRVEIYNGSTLLGSSNSSPYIYPWNNVAAGNYNLTAKAYNNIGAMVTSNAITISVIVPNVYIKATDYNANGQITQIQYGNGVTTAYTYDPLNFRLMRIYTSNTQAQVIQDLKYTYDSIGQVLSIKDNVNTGTASMNQTYAYDDLNRLVSASGSYGAKTYAYDSIGNITQKEGLTYYYAEANSRTNNTAAGPHAVTSLSDGSIFKYDANGNMVSLQKAGKLTQYAFDSQNRLQHVMVGGLKVADYAYDGDGGRVQKTVYRRDLALYNDNTNALLFGSVTKPLPATAQNLTVDTTNYVGNVYEEEGTRHSKFVYLGSTRVASLGTDGSLFYYHTDHLGGTNDLTDSSGAVRELTEYDPYGQVTIHEKYGTDFATAWYYFTGKPLDDETGLIFLGARYYNPTLGRFITPDTVVPGPSNPQNLNRYSYCSNNPVNFTDPDGHKKHSFWGWLGKIFEDVALAIVAIAAVVFLPELAPVIGSFMAGVVTGAVVGGAIGGISSSIMGGDMGQGILTGAIGGAMFGGIGSFGLSGPAEIGAHFAGGAATGAIDAEITGGNAGINAIINGLSAGASEWAGESTQLFKLTGNYMTDVVKQAALGGVIGGAASSAMGGSFGRGFESGAETSAIAYTANDFVHSASNAFDSQKYNSNNLALSVSGNDSSNTSANQQAGVMKAIMFETAWSWAMDTHEIVSGEQGQDDMFMAVAQSFADHPEYGNGFSSQTNSETTNAQKN